MAREKISVRQQQFGFPDEDLKTSLHDEIVLWLKKDAEPIAKRIMDWKENWDHETVSFWQRSLSKTVDECKNDFRTEVASGEEEIQRYQKNAYMFLSLKNNLDKKKAILNSLEGWQGLGEPPEGPQFKISTQLEVPIEREAYKTKSIVGYADVVFYIKTSGLSCGHISKDSAERWALDTTTVNQLVWMNQFYRRPSIAFDAKSTIPSLGEVIRQLRTYRTYCSWPFYIVSPEAKFARAIADEGFGFIQYPEGEFLRAPMEK